MSKISKRSKILLALVSIIILGLSATPVFAANYHHQWHLSAHHNEPGLVPIEFELGVFLDVITGVDLIGDPIITSYSGSWDFDYRLTYVPLFWWYWWEFAPNVEWEFTYNGFRDKITVKYHVWGVVYRVCNFIPTYAVTISVWVQITARGGTTQHTEYWDDNTNLVFLDHYYPAM